MEARFLIDMDGVVCRGNKLIPGADRFIDELQRLDIPFIFFTNNSQRTRRDVAGRLERLGIRVEERQVFTCAMATARFLAAQKPGGTAFVIGEGGLLHALHVNGYTIVEQNPDYVVVGEGRTLSFEMIERAASMILNGAKLVATNLDYSCPTSGGIRPGCGAVVAMLEAATGRRAFSVGKPSPVMVRAAREEFGPSPVPPIVIGDTMETDILGGIQSGCPTVLVLSGGTKKTALARYAYTPDLIVESLGHASVEEIIRDCGPLLERALPAVAASLAPQPTSSPARAPFGGIDRRSRTSRPW